MSFGTLIKELRIAQEKTLRLFCSENGLDPSNWSKIERDINPPPKDQETLARYAKLLGLAPSTEKWNDFMSQADISRGQIPREFMADEIFLKKLPVFLRTVRGAELTEQQLDDFIAKVREAHTPDEHTR
ncbi:MAG: helix-turn-helix transcriptional regulator [Kiritimatiellae bacterium]|nr:helix-turn-helix transcriptional regulator [Kiritimatiellia bacterium]